MVRVSVCLSVCDQDISRTARARDFKWKLLVGGGTQHETFGKNRPAETGRNCGRFIMVQDTKKV
ncbi:hypothetical protein WDU94_011309 [Cyamophila willieti]